MAELTKAEKEVLPLGWEEAAESMGDEELKELLVDTTNNIEIVTEAMKNDDDVIEAEVELKKAKAPYTENIAVQKAKRKHAINILRERGKLDDGKDLTRETVRQEVSQEREAANQAAGGSAVHHAVRDFVATTKAALGPGGSMSISHGGRTTKVIENPPAEEPEF